MMLRREESGKSRGGGWNTDEDNPGSLGADSAPVYSIDFHPLCIADEAPTKILKIHERAS
jgi:hypothetical protein